MPQRAHIFVSRGIFRKKIAFLTDDQIERLRKAESDSVSEQSRRRENERVLAEERRKVYNEVYGQGNTNDAPKLARLCKGDVPSTSHAECSCCNRRKTRTNQ